MQQSSLPASTQSATAAAAAAAPFLSLPFLMSLGGMGAAAAAGGVNMVGGPAAGWNAKVEEKRREEEQNKKRMTDMQSTFNVRKGKGAAKSTALPAETDAAPAPPVIGETAKATDSGEADTKIVSWRGPVA
ncbi:hypothetical protein HK104_004703, partial [Borealophlyctis nickersoniae]